MGVQSGANLTGMTMSSQSHELKTSSVADHDTTTTFKSFLLGSQDLKVNLCGLQQDICSDSVK